MYATLATMKSVLSLTFVLGSFVGGQGSNVCSEADPSCHLQPTWNLDDDHPCNIEIVSPQELASKFPEGFPTFHDTPFILREPTRNEVFQNLTKREYIASLFPGNTVKLPRPNLFSFAATEISVEDFINSPETTAMDLVDTKLYMLMSVEALSDYIPPKGNAKIGDRRIGIGQLGSGAQWHAHGPGFCEAMHGRKHWLLVPPEKQPDFDRTRPSRHWLDYSYSTYKEQKIWECTIHPGDAIYFPHKWWHTTVNLDSYTSFVTVFYDVNHLTNNH
jgi:Cupin-like domain